MASNSYKNFSFVAFGRIIGTGLQAGFYLIFAMLLEPEGYGQMSYIIALAGTFSIVARFGLSHTVVVYQAKENLIAANQANVLALISTSVAAVILIPINIFAALLCLALSFFIMNQQNLLGLKKYNKFFWIGLSRGVLIISLPVLLYFVLEIPGILIGMAISNFLLSFNFLKSLNSKIESFSHLRKDFKILIHNFGVDSSQNLSRWIDKLLIVPLFGFAFTGLYQFNLQILFFLTLLPLSLHSFLLSEESSGRTHKKIMYFVLLFSVLLVMIVIVLSESFIPQFFPKFVEGIPSLQILIISLIPLSFTAILNAKLQAKQSTKVGFVAIARIVPLLVLIGILGNFYGLVGLSLAVLFSTIIESSFLFVLFLKSKN